MTRAISDPEPQILNVRRPGGSQRARRRACGGRVGDILRARRWSFRAKLLSSVVSLGVETPDGFNVTGSRTSSPSRRRSSRSRCTSTSSPPALHARSQQPRHPSQRRRTTIDLVPPSDRLLQLADRVAGEHGWRALSISPTRGANEMRTSIRPCAGTRGLSLPVRSLGFARLSWPR